MRRLAHVVGLAVLLGCASHPAGVPLPTEVVPAGPAEAPAWDLAAPADVESTLAELRLTPPPLSEELEPIERADLLLCFARRCSAWLDERNDLTLKTSALLRESLAEFETGEVDRWRATERAIAILGQFRQELHRNALVIEQTSEAIEPTVLATLRGQLVEVRKAIETSAGQPHGLDRLAADLQVRFDDAAELRGSLACARGVLELRAKRMELLQRALWLERRAVGRSDDHSLTLQVLEDEFWLRWSAS